MRLERIACLVWLGLGSFLIAGSLQLHVGNLSEPGPGFLPMVTGGLFWLVTLVHLGQLVRKPAEEAASEDVWKGIHWQRGAVVVGGLVFYAFTVEFLGYLVATFLLMVVMFSLYDRRRWKMAIVSSLAVIAVTYVVFCLWLNVQFPAGILEGLGV